MDPFTFTVQTEEKGASEQEPKRPGYWAGSGIMAGPMYSDRDRTRRSPTNPEIAELFRSIVYICTRINFNAFSRQTLRLYVMTKKGHSRIRLHDHEVNGVNPFQTQYIKGISALVPYTRGLQTIEEVVEHPLLTAVMHPNPRWDHVGLMRYVSMCLDLFGFSHWWMEPFMAMRNQTIWPLLSQYMFPQKSGPYELVTHFNYGNMVIPYDEVMEVRDVSARDPYALGLSPAQATFAHYDLFDMFVSYERNIFEQGAAPKLLVSNKDPDAPMGRVERERLQRDINYNLVRGQQGIAWVVDGNLDVKPMSFLPEGMAKLNIGKESMARVAGGFGVPISMVDSTDANRSISESDRKTHAELAIDPRCALFASALTKWTRMRGAQFDKALRAAGSRVRTNFERLVWAFDNPVPENEEMRAKVFDMYLRNGTYEINEVRGKLGLEPRPWGEEPWIQIALTQPSIAQWQREQGQVGNDGKPRSGAMPNNKPPKPDKPLPKPASDELEEGSEETVKPPKKALPAPRIKAVSARWADDWDMADTLVRAALLDIGLGHEERYEDEVITPEQRLEALHALRMNCRSLLRAAGEKALEEILDAQEEEEQKAFGKKAKESINKIFKSTRRFLKSALLSASLLVFGPGEPNAKEAVAIEKAVERELGYLEKFKTAVLEGGQAMDGTFAARFEKYGASMWNDGINMIREIATGSEIFPYEKRVHIGPRKLNDPCEDCAEMEEEGWVPIGTLRSIGDSLCVCECHCEFLFSTEDGEEWICGRGPLEELAFGRTG